MSGLSAMSLRMFRKAFGWSQTETEVFLMDARKACRNVNYHTYWEL